MCADKDVTAKLLSELRDTGKGSGLKGFEQVAAIKCHPELMSVELGLLTPTMKAKRPQIKKYFQADLEALYETIPEVN